MGTNVAYQILFYWVRLLHRLYYRKVVVEGIENIPKGKVIFSPNHQNAIMDALAVLCVTQKPTFFLARGDFFKNRWVAGFLKFLKIYPAYRWIEGFDQLTNNYATLTQAKRWLLQNGAVCIFPEGGHEGVWQLRPLNKGIFRLALETQAETPREPVYIVPVGIHYSSYTRWGSVLYVRFGKAVNTIAAFNSWKMNKARGVLQLKNLVQQVMQQIVLHVDEPYYSFVVSMAPHVMKGYDTTVPISRLYSFVEQCNNLAQHNRQVLQNARQSFDSVQNKLKTMHISPKCLWQKISLQRFFVRSTIRLIVAPVAIIILLYLSPFILLTKAVNRNISDKQFHSSVRFVLLSVLPMWYATTFVALWMFSKSLFFATISTLFFIILSIKPYWPIDFFGQWVCEWKRLRYQTRLESLRRKIEEIISWINCSNSHVTETKTRENSVY